MNLAWIFLNNGLEAAWQTATEKYVITSVAWPILITVWYKLGPGVRNVWFLDRESIETFFKICLEHFKTFFLLSLEVLFNYAMDYAIFYLNDSNLFDFLI